MKILYLNHFLDYRGGVETYLLSLMPELERQGHESVLIYAEGREELARASQRIPSLAGVDHKAEELAYREMIGVLKREQPDLVHIHQVYNIGAIRACLELAPVVLTGHDYRYLCPVSNYYYRHSEAVCPKTFGVRCFPNAFLKGCMTPRPYYAYHYYRRVKFIANHSERFGHVITPSEYTRGRFIQAGFLNERVTALPCFCPIKPLEEPRPLPERPTVLFVGRIRPNKGYKYFVQALGLLPSSVQGVMIGDINDEIRRQIQGIARSAGCQDRLELRGWSGREEIRAAFMQATAFVFPSVWAETLGLVGLEALACGVPVVASDIGGVREWLRMNETGLLVPPKDPVALAESLGRLLQDPNLLAMGQAGLNLIRTRFSVQWHLEQLMQIYGATIQSFA